MPTTHEIRTATIQDVPGIVAVHRQTFIDTYTGLTPDLTPAMVEDHLDTCWVRRKEALYNERIRNSDNTTVVAALGERVVGFCMAQADRTNGSLYVLREHQRGVVSLKLFAAITSQISLDTPHFLTVAQNTPAETFYYSMGCRPTGRDLSKELPVLKGGATIPLVELSITPEALHQSLQRVQTLLRQRSK